MDWEIWMMPLFMVTCLLAPLVFIFSFFQEKHGIRKRIGILILDWLLIVGVAELAFIALFRMAGYGRWDYGLIFDNERQIRAHPDGPCASISKLPCTPDQIAAYHHATTVDFWHDVAIRSAPVILALVAILCMCIAGMVAWENRPPRRTA